MFRFQIRHYRRPLKVLSTIAAMLYLAGCASTEAVSTVPFDERILPKNDRSATRWAVSASMMEGDASVRHKRPVKVSPRKAQYSTQSPIARETTLHEDENGGSEPLDGGDGRFVVIAPADQRSNQRGAQRGTVSATTLALPDAGRGPKVTAKRLAPSGTAAPASSPLRAPAPTIARAPALTDTITATIEPAAAKVNWARLGPTRNENPAVVSLVEDAGKATAQGRHHHAAASIERALRISPQDADLWHRLARIRLTQGQAPQAEEFARRSNSLAGTDRRLQKQNWELIADAQGRQGLGAGAAKASAKARSLSVRS